MYIYIYISLGAKGLLEFEGLLTTEGKRTFGRHRRSGGIILRWIFKKWNGVAWTEWIWLRIGTDGRSL